MKTIIIDAFKSGDCHVDGKCVSELTLEQLEIVRNWLLFMVVVYSVQMHRRGLARGNLDPNLEPSYIQHLKDHQKQEEKRQSAGVRNE